MKKLPLALIVLDGIAHNPSTRANAVHEASTPTLDHIWSTYPYTELTSFGPAVGLPDGQMGNSEVGHLNIGAGRIVKQELTLINEAIQSSQLQHNESLEALCKSLPDGAAVHCIGLVSTGGVHSSDTHITALAEALASKGVSNIFLHAITDGRDRPTQAGCDELLSVEAAIKEIAARHGARITIASVIGRYWAMDRDSRWDRTKRAYDLFFSGAGTEVSSVRDAFDTSYADDVTDEFIEPFVIKNQDSALERSTQVQGHDAILFCNFRADRMRQLVQSIFDKEFTSFERAKTPRLSTLASLTEYDDAFPVDVLFRPQMIKNHFGEVVSAAGLRQLRLAETEKYPHVTYFFSGGREEVLPGEERIVIPSPRDVATYDLKPEMSAEAVTDALCVALENNRFDIYIVNYANGDMVGHTGNFEATRTAVEVVDRCLDRVLRTIEKAGGLAAVTADHGNADQMLEYDTGAIHTYHTLHPVPFCLVGQDLGSVSLAGGGSLCDIAPTLCELAGIQQPPEMSGRSLVQ